MDRDRQNLLRQLFAIMTAVIEDAAEPAIAGQHPSLDGAGAESAARAVATAAADLKTLADTASLIARL